MLLRASSFFLFFFLSVGSWSAGITIEVDGLPTMDQLLFDAPDEAIEDYPSVFTGAGISDYSMFRIEHDGARRLSIQPTEDGGLLSYIQSGAHLKRITFSSDGVNESFEYPALPFSNVRMHMAGDTPYAVDSANDTVWYWDNELSVWRDLGATMRLPAKLEQDALSLSTGLLVSSLDVLDQGLWFIDASSAVRVSTTPLSQGLGVHIAASGFVQLSSAIENQNTLTIPFRNMVTGVTGEISNINLSQVDDAYFTYGEHGSLIRLQGDNFYELFWLAKGAEQAEKVTVPEGVMGLISCIHSLGKQFCLFTQQDGPEKLFEYVNNEFVLDAVADIKNVNGQSYFLLSLHAVGGNRFMSVTDGNYIRLLNVNADGVHDLGRGSWTGTDFPPPYIHVSGQNQFYWMVSTPVAYYGYKIDIEGSTEFQRVYTDDTDTNSENTEGARDSSSSSSSDSGIGSHTPLILVILFSIFGLRKPRKAT